MSASGQPKLDQYASIDEISLSNPEYDRPIIKGKKGTEEQYKAIDKKKPSPKKIERAEMNGQEYALPGKKKPSPKKVKRAEVNGQEYALPGKKKPIPDIQRIEMNGDEYAVSNKMKKSQDKEVNYVYDLLLSFNLQTVCQKRYFSDNVNNCRKCAHKFVRNSFFCYIEIFFS